MNITLFKEKIETKTLHIGIIGLGYVGLPLGIEFSKNGFNVTGFEKNAQKASLINQQKSYIPDISDQEVADCVDQKLFRATTDFSNIRTMDVLIICVPTPLSKTKDPDLSYVVNSIQTIKQYAKKGQLIVLESTTYPGTTEEIIVPELSEFTIGTDIFLAFSPERVDPGNETYKIKNTPKVIGGVTEACTQVSELLYSQAIDQVIPVSSTKAAEMVKLLENTFRSINIGLANELALMCDKLDVDVWEVIEAAATKPFGFMPFYPGPGLGGHCIPIDPFYLSWKLKTLNYDARFINLASDINSSMPHHVVNKVIHGLNQHEKSVNGSKILIIGIAYKPNIDDMRESPALDIIQELLSLGANIDYHDKFNDSLELAKQSFKSVSLDQSSLSRYDCCVIVTNHDYLDKDLIINHSKLIIDTRNMTKGISKDHIIKI
ncbi:UDP-N-acetyl-D-glucosamine dehydrogenase [Candidatus Marinamargulisbacteria bacterium SCGC AG-410-N11]|nr:UDP-N-acetyl-D-glucosamine dehydrogenase [Candidatus Marinamargulisbacteria bacterium SCGC AG-410-N11]